ncbi:MAG: hypothetical protein BMS9Abin18_0654 [Zetaproteobacteria bacterium]|nr:MAG: hypothetical protein BMS9Abin18_0654 [Zetaproteobacteria bacterium]
MPDLFVWYHADATLESELKTWLQSVQSELGVQGSLYIRKHETQTTFMEVFPHIESATVARIKAQANKTSCFDNIRRSCESFEKVKSDD